MNSQIELDNIIEVISKAKKIGIFTHISPDGDAIGSSLALCLGLKKLNKQVEVVADECSSCFNFLKGIDLIKREGSGDYDLSIVLDCATKARLYDKNGSFDGSKVTIAIDHHISNNFFATYNYVEGDSPATCKTLIKILKLLNIKINKEIGECLMAGIITDSGGFRYDTVDDETFEFAAHMLDLGVNVSDIYYRTFDFKTKAQFQLFTIATSRLKFYSNDKVAVTYLDEEDFIKSKAGVGDHEGIVDIGRNIEGVEVSIFLREEMDEVYGRLYKISLRSNNYVNVSEVAEVFRGGGHAKAAGVVMQGELNSVINKLIKEINKRL